MKFRDLALIVGVVLALPCSVADEANAMPLSQNVGTSLSGTRSFQFEAVSCRYHCFRRIRRRRYVDQSVQDYVVPVYPAPPVGVTFRKLFDAGYL